MFSLKRGSAALSHAILMGPRPQFCTCSQSKSAWNEMAGELGGKRRLSQDTGTGNKHKNGYNTEWKDDFPWHVPFRHVLMH